MTRNMKKLWHVARDYDITTYKLSERIITQMLFSETMFGEEEILRIIMKEERISV